MYLMTKRPSSLLRLAHRPLLPGWLWLFWLQKAFPAHASPHLVGPLPGPLCRLWRGAQVWGMCRGPWSPSSPLLVIMVRQRLYCTAFGQAHMPPFGCPVLQGQLAPGLAGSDGIGDVCLKTPGPRDPSSALRSRTQRDQHLPSPLCDLGANVCV